MSTNPVTTLAIFLPIIGFLCACALSAAYKAGQNGGGTQVAAAIITMVIAGLFIFTLGQKMPYTPILQWWLSLSRPH